MKLKKKCFLVTGGTGFIGSNICKLLVKNGHKVLVYDNNSRGSLNKISNIKNKISFIKGDIRDRTKLFKNLRNVDAVIHLAYINGTKYFYTKADLIKYFGLSYNDEIIQSPQVWGGSFFIKKCKSSEDLLNKHYDITRNRYDLIDDDESKFVEKALPGFISHRHSQGVLSILAKKINCKFISAYESEWALDERGNRTFEHTNSFPIIAKRDKQKNIFFRFIDRQAKNIRRRINRLRTKT